MNVTCSNCKSILFLSTDICFYPQNNAISLIIKPELIAKIINKSINIIIENKYSRICCKHCDSNLGCQVPYGPNGANFYALGTEKIVFGNNIRLKRKDKWRVS